MHKYLAVIAEGPMMIVRCPAVARKDGLYYVAPKWGSVLKAMTTVMKSHGLRKKDLYALDPAGEPGSDTYQTYEAAYAGNADKLGAFWLYDWEEATQSFRLVRASTPGS